jgi:Bacterial PH domain/Short C-terminal domain
MAKDELRPDIAAAVAQMPTKLGSGREIKRLESVLWDGEAVDMIVSGQYGGGTGLLVLTDRRLLFYKEGITSGKNVDFPLDKVSSVEFGKGMLLGKIVIFASGNKVEIGNVDKNHGRLLAEHVRNRIHGQAGSATPAAPAVPASPSFAPPSTEGAVASGAETLRAYVDQIERLGQLRDAGVLTEDEFQTKKAQILERM